MSTPTVDDKLSAPEVVVVKIPASFQYETTSGDGQEPEVACGAAEKTSSTRSGENVVGDDEFVKPGLQRKSVSSLPLVIDGPEMEAQLRRRALAAMRQGWSAAKSPKSYWLRRHSDSLVVDDRGPSSVVGDDRELDIHEFSSRTENRMERDSLSSFSGDLRSEHDESQPDRDPESQWRLKWPMKAELHFDWDDVFDDADEPQSSVSKSSPNLAAATRLNSTSSLMGTHRVFSPAAVVGTWLPSSPDDIAMRLERHQSADVVRSSAPRSRIISRSATHDDDRCGAGLQRILEQREELDLTLPFSRHRHDARGDRHVGNVALFSSRHETVVVPSWSSSNSYYDAVTTHRPMSTSTPSMSGMDYIDLTGSNERRHQPVGYDDSSPEDLITTTSKIRRSRSVAQSASASKTSRTQQHRMTPSPSATPSESTAAVVDSSMSSTTSSSKLHRCPVCRRSFARSDMLERHARLHTGIRPYSCRLCSQVFSRSDHLTTHLRTHTGEKPYQCPRCSYSASRRDMVTRHLRVHVHETASGRGRGRDGSASTVSPAHLSPLNVGGGVSGVRRRLVRTKKKERQHLVKPALSRSLPTEPAAKQSVPVAIGGTFSQPTTIRRHPAWMSSMDRADGGVIKAAVESWARSSMKFGACLPSPSPMRPLMSFQHGADEAMIAVTSGGLSHLLGRGSTGSMDSYNSPGCCSVAGGSDVFEFGMGAEDSPDVFRSPTVTARHTAKFLWPLAAPSAMSPSSCSGSPRYLYDSGI